ncbi:MAG: GNAT family N-acetyltransferase [Anaerolineales bacterium]
MDITIRSAKPDDAQVLVQILRETADEDNERTPVTEAYAKANIASPGSAIPLAEANGAAAGRLSYSIRPNLFHAAPACLIERPVARKEMRSHGAGSAWMQALPSRAGAPNCAEVSVSTMPGNAGAIRFYRRQGLTEEALFLEKHFPQASVVE